WCGWCVCVSRRLRLAGKQLGLVKQPALARLATGPELTVTGQAILLDDLLDFLGDLVGDAAIELGLEPGADLGLEPGSKLCLESCGDLHFKLRSNLCFEPKPLGLQALRDLGFDELLQLPGTGRVKRT